MPSVFAEVWAGSPRSWHYRSSGSRQESMSTMFEFFFLQSFADPIVPRTFLISCPCLIAMLTFARF